MAKQGMEERNEDVLEDGAELRVYELGFHLDPELPSEEVKKAYQEMRELAVQNGTLVAEGEPQTMPLAYTISRQETTGRRDFSSAYFCWIVYETSAASHAEVIRAAGADKRIVRFIDLVTTKDAARSAAEAREFSAKTLERAKDPEAAIGAELDAALEHAV